MNTQLINQIKALPGVKEVTEVNGMAVVVFEPRKPVLYDEYGVPLFEGNKIWWINKSIDFIFDSPYVKIKQGIKFEDGTKIFSTPESAQKWIDEQKKPKPIYTDPEDGTEFFEGDECWWFINRTYQVKHACIENVAIKYGSELYSKIFKSHKQCELALAKFITDKYK